AAALVLLGVVIWVATDKGTIKIVVDDPDVTVRVDGQVVRIDAPGGPITLRAGEHELQGTRGDLVGATPTVTVRRGGNDARPGGAGARRGAGAAGGGGPPPRRDRPAAGDDPGGQGRGHASRRTPGVEARGGPRRRRAGEVGGGRPARPAARQGVEELHRHDA